MNILTFVPVITSGAAWSGAGGQLRLGGCCHEAPALSVTSWESSAGAIRVPGTGRPATRPAETERRGEREEDTLEEPRSISVAILGHTRDRPHPDLLNNSLKNYHYLYTDYFI